MKEGKMKLSEYTKMCKWCRTNGFKEIDKNSESIDGKNLYADVRDFTKRDGRLFVRVFSLAEFQVKIFYVQVFLQWSNQLPVGLFDTIRICKTISTANELESLVSKVEDLNRLSNVFDLYQL